MTATIDPGTKAGARALERLGSELIGWLTTTNPDGQPQSSPIWFLWLGDEVLIYSGKRAPRNGNLADRPLVSFNLNTDAVGGDVATMEGLAQHRSERRPGPREPAIRDQVPGPARRVRLDRRVLRRRIPGRDPSSDRPAGASGELGTAFAGDEPRWDGRRDGRRGRGLCRQSSGGSPARGEDRAPAQSHDLRRAVRGIGPGADAARDADDRGSTRRLPAVGAGPARSRRPRSHRRAAPASTATWRSRSSPSRPSRRGISTSSATRTIRTTSSSSRWPSAGRRPRGGACWPAPCIWRVAPMRSRRRRAAASASSDRRRPAGATWRRARRAGR